MRGVPSAWLISDLFITGGSGARQALLLSLGWHGAWRAAFGVAFPALVFAEARVVHK